MNAHWDDLRLFLCVAESGSLSAAARTLRLGQATLSRRMAAFEEVVGEPLFERSTQGISLTPMGKRLINPVQNMAHWAAEVQLNRESSLQESVCIAASPSTAQNFLAPMSVDIRKKHPHLRIEILSGIGLVNLHRGEADIALRTVAPESEDLVCLDQVSSAIRAFATPEYIQSRPKNFGPQDCEWIVWASSFEEIVLSRLLKSLVGNYKVAFASNDRNVQLAACHAGLGVMLMAVASHRYTNHVGPLQELPWSLGPEAIVNFYMVAHKRTAHLPKVLAVSAFISSEFAVMRSRHAERSQVSE